VKAIPAPPLQFTNAAPVATHIVIPAAAPNAHAMSLDSILSTPFPDEMEMSEDFADQYAQALCYKLDGILQGLGIQKQTE